MMRAMELWLPAYLAQVLSRTPRPPAGEPLTIYLAVADHFEPFWGRASEPLARQRLAAWERELGPTVQELGDALGRVPQHTFFYPLEDYRPEFLDRLAALCDRGLGQVEVHLHHQGESSAQLEEMLLAYAEKLHQRHGLLRRDPESGRVLYGFIHGNWALDNSLPDGSWCGVNDEISILARTGCYADFTLPSAPSPAQTRTINAIYYATDDPLRPKSHDRGRPSRVGGVEGGDLLLVQGVLALDWRRRKWGLVPRLETSDLSGHLPPSASRMRLWLAFAPRVHGAPQACFIKLSCHGAPEKNQPALLGPVARDFYRHLTQHYNDGQRFRLCFVTCWEMVQAIHALEQGSDPP